MRNLSILFQKFGFVLLFLALEGVAFFLTLQRGDFQKVAFLNSTTEVTGRIYSYYGDFREYFYLRHENEILAEENIRLRAMIEQSRRNFAANPTFTDSTYEQAFTYIPCKVVNNSLSKSQNYFTIDAGNRQGIEEGMGIISPSGIAGIVKGTSENFAVCMSVLNINYPVSVRMKKSNDEGVLSWDGKSSVYSKVMGVPNHVNVQQGDTVITSGNSSIYPEGIPVGYVISYTVNPDDGSYIISIRLATSFTSLRQVYAIHYEFKREQKALEDSVAVDVGAVSHE